MSGSVRKLDSIADMHWWMTEHIHYLPAMIYTVLMIDIVLVFVVIRQCNGLKRDELLAQLQMGISVAVFLLGMLLVYHIAYLFW